MRTYKERIKEAHDLYADYLKHSSAHFSSTKCREPLHWLLLQESSRHRWYMFTRAAGDLAPTHLGRYETYMYTQFPPDCGVRLRTFLEYVDYDQIFSHDATAWESRAPR